MTFGPWEPTIDHAERVARLRAMRALGRTYARPHSEFLSALRKAETDAEALPVALELLDRLPALTRRRLLAAYSGMLGGEP